MAHQFDRIGAVGKKDETRNNMTGDEHNRRQILVRTMATATPLSVAIATLILRLALGKPHPIIVAIFVASLAVVPIAIVLLRQKCPFCHRTLTLNSKQTYYGEYCRHCGEKFSNEIVTVSRKDGDPDNTQITYR